MAILKYQLTEPWYCTWYSTVPGTLQQLLDRGNRSRGHVDVSRNASASCRSLSYMHVNTSAPRKNVLDLVATS
eukprot:3753898-Pyramimonas_sp.AAC.2